MKISCGSPSYHSNRNKNRKCQTFVIHFFIHSGFFCFQFHFFSVWFWKSMSFGDSSEASKLLEAALLQMDGIIQVRPQRTTVLNLFTYHVLVRKANPWGESMSTFRVIFRFIQQACVSSLLKKMVREWLFIYFLSVNIQGTKIGHGSPSGIDSSFGNSSVG